MLALADPGCTYAGLGKTGGRVAKFFDSEIARKLTAHLDGPVSTRSVKIARETVGIGPREQREKPKPEDERLDRIERFLDEGFSGWRNCKNGDRA